MYTAYHHLEPFGKEKTQTKAGETVERRTRRLLEEAEDSATYADVEAAC